MVKSNKIWEYHITRRGEYLKIIDLDGGETYLASESGK